MTTIAYRDGVLAADSQVTCGSWRDGTMTKICKRGDVFAAGCGNAGAVRSFLDWFRSGMIGAPPQMPTDGDDETSCYIFRGRRLLAWEGNRWMTSQADYYAFGTGGRFARGAMEMGATPETAVGVACKIDIYSGGAIEVLRSG